MALRKTIPLGELRERYRERSTAEEREREATNYQPPRGGWYKRAEQPVPGTPKKGR